MNRLTLILATVTAVVGYSASAAAQGDIAPVPIPLDPATIDITGTWNYSTANHKVSGDCPNGSPMNGTLAITREGAEAGLMIMSGATCDPASMCMFGGGLTGEYLLVSNTDTVDEEGGTATNAIQMFFSSPAQGSGSASSSYVHPEGFQCQWSHDVLIWRSEE